jgi:basic membrane protein A
MRKLLLALGAAASLVMAGPAVAQTKAALLLPGSINDQSWNAQGYAGLMKLKEMGVETAYSENVQAADHVEAMRDYARQGFALIIGHSGRFLSAAQRVGPEFEKTQFIVGSGSAGAGKNVTSIDYDNAQYGYLLGVLAARMSKTGKVGSVNSLEGLPNVVAQVGGFRQGVKSVRPDAEVKVIYIKEMEDAAMAKEAAFSLIAGGADVITGKLNAGHAGIIQAAKEKGILATGRSFGHTAIAPDTVLTNIIEKWAEMYAAAGAEVKAGKLSGDYALYGIGSTGSTGAELRQSAERAYVAAVPAGVTDELEMVKKKLGSGELKLKVTKEDARGGV